jgi:hypothetical protein
VHGNATHFAYDVAAAALLCLVFGPALRLLWMAPLIGVGILAALPDVQHYYGLSALLHAWVVAIAARSSLDERGPRRWLAAAVLLGTLGKAALETSLGLSVLTSDIDFGGPVLYASHLVGALVGLGFSLLTWVRCRAPDHAQQVHRLRRHVDYLRENRPRPGSLRAVAPALVERGPVFTAHPTEAVRGQVAAR